MARRWVLLLVAAGAVALPAGSASARSERELVLGTTDQHQPIALRLDHRHHRLRVSVRLLQLKCRGRGAHSSDFGAPSDLVVRSIRWFPVRRGGVVRTTFIARRHPVRADPENSSDVRLRSRVTFRVKLGPHGTAKGTFRARTTVRELAQDTESAGHLVFRFSCDTGLRRWRVPRFAFSGPWRPTRSMRVGDAINELLPLAGGGALVLENDSGTQAYSARSDRWRSTGKIPDRRYGPTLAALRDGGAVAVGGDSEERPSAAVDRYDPRRHAWKPVAAMRVGRTRPAVVTLRDGKVLVLGGFTETPSAGGTSADSTGEIYDPALNRWLPTAPMPGPSDTNVDSSFNFFAETLASGKVLVVGGYWGAQAATWTTYDPATDTWAPRQPLPRGFKPYGVRHVALSDARVLAYDCEKRAAALFGPTGWTQAAPVPSCRGSAGPLPSGRALFVDDKRAYVSTPALDRWVRAPRPRFPHVRGAPLLSGTRVGALLVDPGAVNRFSAAERFFER
jgi:hypothetical protein